MSWRVVVRSGAEEDLAQAAVWYERQQAGLGSMILDESDRLLARIEKNIGTSQIEIIAVLHLHKEPAILKSRT